MFRLKTFGKAARLLFAYIQQPKNWAGESSARNPLAWGWRSGEDTRLFVQKLFKGGKTNKSTKVGLWFFKETKLPNLKESFLDLKFPQDTYSVQEEDAGLEALAKELADAVIDGWCKVICIDFANFVWTEQLLVFNILGGWFIYWVLPTLFRDHACVDVQWRYKARTVRIYALNNIG